MSTTGWENIIQPLIDKMISDVLGSKNPDGSYAPGVYNYKNIASEEVVKAFAYRQGLTDLCNHLCSYFALEKKAKQRLDRPEATEVAENYVMPMHDTRYADKDRITEMMIPREGGE